MTIPSALMSGAGSAGEAARTYDRERVAGRLRSALESRVTLVVAPVGFGKSVAVRQVLASQQARALWFEIDPHEGNEREIVAHLKARDLASDTDADCIVIDGADRLSRTSVKTLVGLVERVNAGRWIFLMRSSDGWPVGRWIDAGLCRFPIGSAELRFTDEEAFAMLHAASSEAPGATHHSIQGLMLLAEGWPIALGLAAMAIRAGLPDPIAATRVVIEQHVRDEIFATLSPSEWDLLVQSACVGDLRPDWLQALQDERTFSDDTIRSLRAKAPWLEVRDARSRLPKVVRALVARRALGEPGRSRLLFERAGAVNEDTGRASAALRAYLVAGDLESVERIVRRDGFTSAFALDDVFLGTALMNGARDVHRPIISALRGVHHTRRLHVQEASAAFTLALAAAPEADRRLIAVAYAQALLLMHRTAEAFQTLEAYEPPQAESLQLSYFAAKASAAVFSDRVHEAREARRTARSLLPRARRGIALCWSLTYLAGVSLALGDADEGDRYSSWAVQLARDFGLRALEAKALYYRYPRLRDNYHRLENNGGTMELVRALAADAHDRLLEARTLKALVDVWARRGNDDEVNYYEQELKKIAPPSLPGGSDWISARPHAMRCAWHGDFRSAAEYTRASFGAFQLPDWRYLRMAEYMLFTTQFEASRAFVYLDDVTKGLAEISTPARRGHALTVLGAALAVAGEPYMDYFLRAEREAAAANTPRLTVFLRAFLEFAHAMRRRTTLPQVHHEALISNSLGGWSRILAALKPVSELQLRLTPTQMEVLMRVRRGLKSTAIAAELNMAPGTVKKHVDRICARLGAEGRLAAVAIADRYGLFED